VSNDPQTWAEVLRVLKPGGHLLAFGGTRTFHRLTCAIEDAGFEIRDCVSWLYGSGFPKSHNLGTGWGTALKPAWEPIILARKPLIGTVAVNVERYGTGAINVDGCRIGFASQEDEEESKQKNRHADFGSGEAVGYHGWESRAAGGNYDAPGRWPANLVLDEDAATMLDAEVGNRPSGSGRKSTQKQTENTVYGRGLGFSTHEDIGGDTGGPSRFFYCAKASRAERNAGLEEANHHPTVKPLALMRWLVRLVTPPGGSVLDPFMGSGTTGIACVMEGFDFFGIDTDEEYVEMARRRIAHAQKGRS
jgi:site-specific DNA-methyltransferase (adenine-specific)